MLAQPDAWSAAASSQRYRALVDTRMPRETAFAACQAARVLESAIEANQDLGRVRRTAFDSPHERGADLDLAVYIARIQMHMPAHLNLHAPHGGDDEISGGGLLVLAHALELVARMRETLLTQRNAHRAVAAGVSVAHKVLAERPLPMRTLASIFGLATSELALVERALLQECRYRVSELALHDRCSVWFQLLCEGQGG